MKRYLLFALMALSIAACKKDPDGDVPDGPVSTALQEVTFDKMPATGEQVSGMDMNASGVIASAFGGKLYVSDPSGQNWTLINGTDIHYEMIFCNDGSLLAATNNGLKRYSTSWVKTDVAFPSFGAASWTRFGKSNTGVYCFSPSVNSSMGSVYYSTNNGDNWTLIPAPTNTGSSYAAYGFGVTPDDKISIVSFQYFARTTDMGQNWTVTQRQFPTAMAGNWVYEASNGNIFVYRMATSNAYLVSTDGGANFTEVDLYNNVGMTAVWEKDGKVYCSLYDHEGRKGAGIYESTDGGVTSNGWNMKFPCWPQIVKTNGNRWVYAEVGHINFPNIRNRGLGISNDNAATWFTTGPSELPNYVQDFEFDNDGNLLVAINGALYKRINNNWQLIGAPGCGSTSTVEPPIGLSDSPNRNKIVKTPNGDIVYLHGGANNGGALAAMRVKPNGTLQFLQYIGAATNQTLFGITGITGATAWNNNDVVYCGTDGNVYQIRVLKADMSDWEKVSPWDWTSMTGNGYTIYGTSAQGGAQSSMDQGVTVEDFDGSKPFPIAFKNTETYFGREESKYYISNFSGSNKAEVTFEDLYYYDVIQRVRFAPDGKLWLLKQVEVGNGNTLFKTDATF